MHAGKLCGVGAAVGLIIPAHVLRELGWQKGDYIAVEVDGEEVKLHNVKALSVRFRNADNRGRDGRQPAAVGD